MNMKTVFGRGGGGQTAAAAAPAPYIAPNTLRTQSYGEVIAVIGEGPIEPPTNVYQQIYLDDVPIQGPDGVWNFSGVRVDYRLGYPDQAYIPGAPAAEDVIAVGVKTQYAVPIVRAITDVTATRARITVTIPALFYVDNATGSQYPTGMVFAVYVQPNGGSYEQVLTVSFYEKCVSQAQLTYDIPLNGDGPWNIKLIRGAPDSTTTNFANDLYWSTYSVVRDYRLSYPDTAFLYIKINAQQFSGKFPTISYQGKMLLLQIPSNYNPITRVYTGVWDGTFQTAWTDNPAWVLWEVLTNERWGLGHYINVLNVDKWGLYAAAQWFDELVPDGYGGFEPRFTFNGTIDSAVEAERALAVLAGACQSVFYWASGAVNIVVDKANDPVAVLGPANVVNGKFTYSGSDVTTRPTSVQVTWQDANNSFIRAIEVAEDLDLVEQYGLRVNEVAAPLCTSQGQAQRTGRWEIETPWSNTQTVTFKVGPAQCNLVPGYDIDIADPSFQGRRMFGRLLSVVDTTVTLDSTVLIEAGQTYELVVPGSDGVLQTRAAFGVAGYTDTLTIASAFSPAPVDGAVWQLVASNLAPRRFRVLTNEEQEGGAYSITALIVDVNKQARVEDGFILELPAFSAYQTGAIAAPTGIVASETIRQNPAGTWQQVVTVGWNTPTDPRVIKFELQYHSDLTTEWTDYGSVIGVLAEITDELGSGAFTIRLRAIGFDGAASPWAESSVVLYGLLQPPADVTGFTINIVGSIAILSWNPVSQQNFSHYEVRFSSNNLSNWESMVPIVPKAGGTSIHTAARTGLFAVKAVSSRAIPSTNAAFISANVYGLAINVVETLIGDPTWVGIPYNTKIDYSRNALVLKSVVDLFDNADLFDFSDLLTIVGVTTTGYFEWPPLDLGEIIVSRISANLNCLGERIVDDLWQEANIWTLPNVWGDDPGGWDAHIEIATTDDDPYGVSPVWSEWRRLVVSDVSARGIWARFVLSTSDSSVTPVAKGSIVIDVPDSDRKGANVAVSVGGTRVPFENAFRGPIRPSVVVTAIEGAQAGDWADITNVDRTGFDVIVRNGVTAQSGRYIDYHAKGYGVVIPPPEE